MSGGDGDRHDKVATQQRATQKGDAAGGAGAEADAAGPSCCGGVPLVAVLASLSLAGNYGARGVVPMAAHTLCGPSRVNGCDDATELVSACLSAFFFGDLLAQVCAGPLVRWLGGRSLLCLGTSAWALSMLLMPFTLEAPRSVFLATQATFGLLGGMGFPSCHALVAEGGVPAAWRFAALTMMNSAAALGPMFANLVMPSAIQRLGWQAPFFALGVVGLVTAALCATYCPDRPDATTPQSHSPLRGIVTATVGLASDAERWLRDPLLQSMVVSIYATSVAMFGLMGFIPTLFVDGCGVKAEEIGGLTAIPPLAQVLSVNAFNIMSGRLMASGAWTRQQCRWKMQAIATFGPAACLLLLSIFMGVVGKGGGFGVSPAAVPTVASVLITAWLGTATSQNFGLMAVLHDVAKARAGELFVLVNVFSKLAAVVAAPLLGWTLRSFGWGWLLFGVACHYIVAASVFLPQVRRTDSAAKLFAPLNFAGKHV